MTPWLAVVSPIAELIKQWFSNRREESKAKHEANLKHISNTATWEQQQVENSKTSWKDEWFTVLLSTPIIAIMYGVAFNNGDIVYRVGLAFNQLENLPLWYQYLLGIAVTASFGIKGADKVVSLIKRK